MPTLFMFSGQGSHYYDMGAELFAKDPTFRHWMRELDDIAAPLLNLSVIDLLYHQGKKKSDTFDRTRLTSPAIFMVEYALARSLMANGVQPDAVLGTSLGTMVAACVAGCLSPQSALVSVVKKAEILEATCAPGTMVAILADPQTYLNEPDLHDNAELAGVNYASHFVVATLRNKLPAITAFLDRQQLTYQVLAVSQAFHSRWIDAAREPCLRLFGALPLETPHLPLICCAAQERLDRLDPQALWHVMRGPIHFERTLAALELRGPWRYIDVGPSASLATMLKYGLDAGSRSKVHSVMRPFGGDFENLRRLVALNGE